MAIQVRLPNAPSSFNDDETRRWNELVRALEQLINQFNEAQREIEELQTP